jgi:hypothetical protein
MATNQQRWSSTGSVGHGKLAVNIPEAAEALGVSEGMARLLASTVQPHRHQDGSERWPLRELARVLADTGRVVGPE